MRRLLLYQVGRTREQSISRVFFIIVLGDENLVPFSGTRLRLQLFARDKRSKEFRLIATLAPTLCLGERFVPQILFTQTFSRSGQVTAKQPLIRSRPATNLNSSAPCLVSLAKSYDSAIGTRGLIIRETNTGHSVDLN